MNPIKAFFKKREVEKNFKKAGPGHKLTEGPRLPNAAAVPSTSVPATHRQPPPDCARRAAEAALARLESQQTTPVNWSQAAIRAQARKEIELEKEMAEKIKHTPKEVIQDSGSLLSVSGVYFACPLIGPEVLSRPEIEAKIREFLYAQLAEERGLTSCLIIHTCNKGKEKVRLCIETLARYLKNIIDNPTEEKYRKIRVNNKIFQERVAGVEGALDFLIAVGFNEVQLKQDDKEEKYFIFPEEKLNDLEDLKMLKDALLSAEPIKPVLDRNKQVLKPSHVTKHLNLPEEFFCLSSAEIRKEQEEKTRTVELNAQLRTRAMKERDEIKEYRIYKYTLIRIRFPDDIILQGTFSVGEKLLAVKEFIIDNLAEKDREFLLLVPGGLKLSEDESTLNELKLVPAALLNFHWKDDRTVNENANYLSTETLALLQDS